MDYWLDNRMIDVEKDGFTYELFRYFAPSEGPRPESYRLVLKALNDFNDLLK